MQERLQNYFYSERGRITGLGSLLAYWGMALLLLGAIGKFVTSTINILPTLAQQAETAKTLADIYPTLPLWWVPESWLGAAGSGLLVIVGIYVAYHGKTVDRMLKQF